ncbi:phage tail protein [Sphingomonas hengshuiensis]|uniref:Phage tail collar domain-containing protein n=1 Tax=Sphingomonas hengshuiensis TaxID=1609977 RepID=A0A7U4J9A8_9SPHN|nr:tail fiber protein [Sphingomonas hengshuiensis]AJP72625.1 hypothetical protein TS85_13850 [Sphingomonas hengshuiensis]
MTQPYLGQIEIYGFNFPPNGWAFAAGQTLPLAQNTALFSLIGVTFGGNGTTSFLLPNLASRMACGTGQGPGLSDRPLGVTFGTEQVTLSMNEMPSHQHALNACLPAGPTDVSATPSPNTAPGISSTGESAMYAPLGGEDMTMMNPMAIQPTGGSLPHNNVQPFLGLNYSIALAGIFPQFD